MEWGFPVLRGKVEFFSEGNSLAFSSPGLHNDCYRGSGQVVDGVTARRIHRISST